MHYKIMLNLNNKVLGPNQINHNLNAKFNTHIDLSKNGQFLLSCIGQRADIIHIDYVWDKVYSEFTVKEVILHLQLIVKNDCYGENSIKDYCEILKRYGFYE